MRVLLLPSQMRKAKALPEGTVKKWGGRNYKKISGKWMPITMGKKTKPPEKMSTSAYQSMMKNPTLGKKMFVLGRVISSPRAAGDKMFDKTHVDQLRKLAKQGYTKKVGNKFHPTAKGERLYKRWQEAKATYKEQSEKERAGYEKTAEERLGEKLPKEGKPIQKARKFPEGTIRDWKGKKYKKVAGKWVRHTGGKKAAAKKATAKKKAKAVEMATVDTPRDRLLDKLARTISKYSDKFFYEGAMDEVAQLSDAALLETAKEWDVKVPEGFKPEEKPSFDQWAEMQGDEAAEMSFGDFISEYSFDEEEDDYFIDPNERREYAEQSAREHGMDDYVELYGKEPGTFGGDTGVDADFGVQKEEGAEKQFGSPKDYGIDADEYKGRLTDALFDNPPFFEVQMYSDEEAVIDFAEKHSAKDLIDTLRRFGTDDEEIDSFLRGQ